MSIGEETDNSGIPEPGISERWIKCPACGHENLPDAVFCEKPGGHKALGALKCVNEELLREARWSESAAARVIRSVGSPQFLSAHAFWFVTWLATDLGAAPLFRRFDPYPLSGYAEKRAELDYEVSVQTYRTLREVRTMLKNGEQRLGGRAER